MWRATWILYFSFHILSAQAQGKKDTPQMSAPRCASCLRSAVPADGGMSVPAAADRASAALLLERRKPRNFT